MILQIMKCYYGEARQTVCSSRSGYYGEEVWHTKEQGDRWGGSRGAIVGRAGRSRMGKGQKRG